MATNDTLAAESCAEFTQAESALRPVDDLVDLPGGGVDEDDRHLGRSARLVLDPEGDGPESARRNPPPNETDVVALRRELDLRARDLDRALLAHVLPAAAGESRQD